MLTIDEAPDHPQMRARDAYAQFDGSRHPSPAPRFEHTPASLRRPMPAPGKHSREVLREWGLTESDVSALEASKAMAQA